MQIYLSIHSFFSTPVLYWFHSKELALKKLKGHKEKFEIAFAGLPDNHTICGQKRKKKSRMCLASREK